MVGCNANIRRRRRRRREKGPFSFTFFSFFFLSCVFFGLTNMLHTSPDYDSLKSTVKKIVAVRQIGKGKGKVIPLQARCGPEGG